MYLKRLDIYGFKTFAQRTTLEFQPGVTAVVGPNGSGKSNISDAVRWVLGEQSFSNLRSKRTEDLIFGGGNKRAPMGFAEVFLTIDNSDRLLPLDFDEVTIGRRAYRNGENEYTINRARVRLRDVLDAVAPLGSSYTLINQGLVDSALALQPQERRRLFEDAAEIGPYQAKKAEAERRLRETEANLLRLNDLVSELEPQLRTLKRQARDAEAVHAVQAELHALLQAYYAAQWARVVTQLNAATAHERTVADQLAAARTAREEAEAALELARAGLRQDRQMGEHRRAMLIQAEREQAIAARELAVAQERLAGVHQRIAEQEQRRQALAEAHAAAHADTMRLVHTIALVRAALADAREQLNQAERGIEHVRGEREAAEQDVGARRAELLRTTTATETARAQVAQAQRRSAALANELDTIAAQLGRASGERDERAATVARAQQVLDDAEQRVRDNMEALEGHAAERERLRQTREAIDEQLSTARRVHGERQTRYDALSRLARSYEGAFAGVRAAMQWAEREGYGFKLVSALLRVPPELETAIEVALGARLQQIVVERWTDAEAAIVQLKRTNAGRATFLPLDTLRPAPRRAAPVVGGMRGVAADLVEIDAHYGQIGAYLLGRTLIADDLQAARRALPSLDGGWTIVTLAGEQVSSGGALTGGAATKESGTLRRERELRDLPKELDAARVNVDRLQSEREQVVQRGAVLQQTIKQAEIAMRDARAARDGAQRMLEAQRRDLHRAEDALHTLARRQATVQDEQGSLHRQQTTLAQSVAEAETAQAAAQVALEAAQQILAERRSAVNDAEQRLEPLRTAQATTAAELRSAEAEARAAEQTLARGAAEQRALDAQHADLAREQVVLTEQIRQVQNTHARAQAAAAAAADQVTAFENALRAAEQVLEALEQRARESTKALLDWESRHADAALAAQRSQNERDALWERAAEDNIDVEQVAISHQLSAISHQPSAVSAQETDPSLVQRIDQLKTRLRRMGPVNALAPAEYEAAQERHTFLSEQLADVRAATGSLRTAIGELDEMMQERFATTFDAIGHEFERSFKQLFGGGSAKLSLVRDAEGSALGGVEIVAQPPGKRLMNLQLLSGGERSLTAAALLFAILKVNPSPFCMLDEVDAALDEANVVRFREALLELAERTQFVIITHNRGTVEAANTLYGITMGDDGGSRMLSLRLEEVDADGALALVT
jgi:chromosome segregation protein